MNESTPHYEEIAAIIMERIDEMITDEVQEKLDRDPEFPAHAEDEEGEAYIADAMDMVYRSIRRRLAINAD